MLHRLMMIACLGLPALGRPAPQILPPSSARVAEVWVDGGRGEGGDGSRERPFSSLAPVLARGEAESAPLRVYLAPGRYRGSFVLPAGLELVGGGEATVLQGVGEEVVVRAAGGVTLRRLGLEGGGGGLKAGGPVELESVRFSGRPGRGTGLFVRGGELRLEDVTLSGFEYGLQALEATVEARGFASVDAARAGVVLLGSRGRFAEARVLGSGSHGGFLLLGSEVVLRDVRVDGADAYGIAATRGRLRVEGAIITRLTSRERDSGDGLHLRDVEVEVEGLVVRDVVGVGVLGAQGSRVTLRDVSLEACQEGGVVAETLGEVSAEGLAVRGSSGPALLAQEGGVLKVDVLSVRDNAAGLVWADCREGTEVHLERVREKEASGERLAPCVLRSE